MPQVIPTGGEVTLTIGDAYYSTFYSSFGGTIPPGTPVWVQVDSVNLNTSYGGVWESDETNNISGPVFPAVILVSESVSPVKSQVNAISTGNLLPRR